MIDSMKPLQQTRKSQRLGKLRSGPFTCRSSFHGEVRGWKIAMVVFGEVIDIIWSKQ